MSARVRGDLPPAVTAASWHRALRAAPAPVVHFAPHKSAPRRAVDMGGANRRGADAPLPARRAAAKKGGARKVGGNSSGSSDDDDRPRVRISFGADACRGQAAKRGAAARPALPPAKRPSAATPAAPPPA